jgi:hypothetical protein
MLLPILVLLDSWGLGIWSSAETDVAPQREE